MLSLSSLPGLLAPLISQLARLNLPSLSRQISAELSAEQRLVELRSERRSSRRGSDVLTKLFLLTEGWVHAERVTRRRR